jgi:lysosomal Pro-X carboxypeptidase
MVPKATTAMGGGGVTGGVTDDVAAMEALRDAAAVLYNVTANKQCYDVSDDPNYDGIWDYQWCSEMLPQETYFTLDGKRDMFWARSATYFLKHQIEFPF